MAKMQREAPKDAILLLINENITAERLDVASIEMLQAFSDFGLLYFAEQCRHWQVMAEIELERRKLEGRE